MVPLLEGWLRWRRGGAGHGADLVAFLDSLASALRVGMPTGRAVVVAGEQVSPTLAAVVVAPVAQAAAAGRPTGGAWHRAARDLHDEHLAVVARVVTLSERLGVPQADAVARAAGTVREHRRLELRLRAATAGAQATVAVLSLLPVAGLGLAAMLGVGPVELYGSAPAQASAAIGVGLLLLGRVIVRRQVGRVRRRLP